MGLAIERMSHDVSGGIGALAGMLELAGDGLPEVQEAGLEAAASTRARLKLYAAAWAGQFGVAHIGAGVQGTSLQAMLTAALGNSRLSFSLSTVPALSLSSASLVLNACMVASEALSRGGEVSAMLLADARRTGQGTVSIRAKGQSALWPEMVVLAMDAADEASALAAGARGIAAPLLRSLAANAGVSVALGQDGDAAVLSLSPVEILVG